MVLNVSVFTRLVCCVAYCLLASCSMMTKQESKRDFLVPAQIPKQELKEESEQQKNDVKIEPQKAPKTGAVGQPEQGESASEKKDQVETREKAKPSPSGSDLLSILLDKASKAMKLQQWLRAQRALEQALRIDPESADTYVLYGDVYRGMGIEEKATEMYKRAIYLSGNDERLRNKLLPESETD